MDPDNVGLSAEEQAEIEADIAALNGRKRATPAVKNPPSILDADAPPPRVRKRTPTPKTPPPKTPDEEEKPSKSIPPEAVEDVAPPLESKTDAEMMAEPAINGTGASIFDDSDFDEEKRLEQQIKPKATGKSRPKETAQERGLVETKIQIWDAHTKRYSLDEEEVSVLSATETDGTKVETGLGFTINLGDMEFARIDARVHLPTVTEEIPVGFNTAWKIADAEVMHQAKKIRESRMNKK